MPELLIQYVDPDHKRPVELVMIGPLVPRKGEHVNLDGNPFVVKELIWKIDGDLMTGQIVLERPAINEQSHGYKGRVREAVRSFVCGRRAHGDTSLTDDERALLDVLYPDWQNLTVETPEDDVD